MTLLTSRRPANVRALLVRSLAGLVLLLPLSGFCAQPAPALRGNLGIHDPSTIIKCKDRYYLFGTGQNIISRWSTDKVFWNTGSSVFAAPPNWTTNAVPGFGSTFWAPDVIYLNGRYCLYYSVSTFGSQVSAIGLATSPTLDPADASYQWTDQGVVIQSTNGSAYNTIDPSVTLDAAGNPWMSFGSYWNGIYLVQLDPLTGLRIASNSPTYRLAWNGSIEASCLHRRGGYYYLFVNWGSCCSGVNSTYHIRVGRSASITGPYRDRNGVDLVSAGGTLFMEGTGKFTGPGHVGILSENGTRWFSYHYYDAGAYAPWYGAYGVADFDFEPLSWTADDWPVFVNDWSAIYDFDADARDENGQYYGLLQGGASIQMDPVHGHVLNLNGTNQYVRLPAGTGFARTFAAVLKWNGGGAWQRIFDFGVDTSRYVMLTPSSGAGRLRLDINGGGGTQTLEWTNPLPANVWSHVAVTLDGSRGVLYYNGAPVATNSSLTISPVNVLAQTNHLGHSKFSADPDFRGQFARFLVHGRALSPAEIVAPQPVITEPAEGALWSPGSVIPFSGSASDFMAVPLGAAALTWRVECAVDGQTNIVFGPVAGVANGVFTVPTNAAAGGIHRVLLTATDGAGRTNTAAVSLVPAHASAGWSSYYPFRGNAADANGHFPGALNGGAAIVSDSERGNVLDLSGSSQYVSLPAGAASLQTFMAWVKWNGGAAWQRIFDFGNDTTRYFALTPSAGNGRLRCNITVNGTAGEQIVDAPSALPVGVWTHVAVVLDGSSGVIYSNGVPVATNANVNMIAADLRATNNLLGRSQWPDPYFNGRLSSVRLFSRALSAAEIVAPQAVIATPAQGSVYRPGEVISFQGGATDFYDAPLSPASLVWSVQYVLNGVASTYLGPLGGVTNGSFTIPASGGGATNGFYRILLAATDSAARKATNVVEIFPYAPAAMNTAWASFYPFTTGAQDVSNRYPGSLVSGAAIQADPSRGNVLNLSGGGQYVSSAAGAANAQTLAAWVKWNGGNPWQRIFDFGQNNNDWVMLTPLDSDGRMQCAISSDRASYVQVIQSAAPLATGVWTHLAVVLDGRQGILYTNAQVAAVNNSVNLLPSDLASSKAYLGKSQYPADAYFNGRIDSLRLNSRAMAPAELFAPAPRITQPTAPALYTGGSVLVFAGAATDYADASLPPGAFTWTAEFHHDGLLDPVLGPLTGVTNGSLAIPATGPASTNVFYRVKLLATDGVGHQQATALDVPPLTGPLSLVTVPPGLQLLLDGQTLSAPTSTVAVVGMQRTLAAPSPQLYAGSNYNFVLWSDAGAQIHTVSMPANGAAYTASFVEPVIGITTAGPSLGLSWPAWAASLQLHSATNLNSPVTWAPVTNAPLVTNGLELLVLPVLGGQQFYRLQSP